MKRLNFMVLLMTICLMAAAQDKMTLGAQQLISSQQAAGQDGQRAANAAEQRVALVIKVNDDKAVETYQAIRALGGEIQGVLGEQALISLPLQRVEAVSMLDGVERIDVEHSGHAKTDVSVKETKVASILGKPAGAATSLTGKGVTICMIDGGFRYDHAAFTDGNGKSRVKCIYLMNQKDDEKRNGYKQLKYTDPKAGEVTAPGYYYDTEAGINNLYLYDRHDNSHGTHTTGIAAGAATDKGFTGMAPGADIIIIPINLNYDPISSAGIGASLEKALMFAVNYAKQQNLNMVISMSLGSHNGPHNGTGTIPELLQETSKIAIPVMASGNEGDAGPHIYKKLTSTDKTLKVLLSMKKKGDTYPVDAETVGYSRQTVQSGQTVKLTLSLIHKGTSNWSHTIEYKVGEASQTWAVSGDPEQDGIENKLPYDEKLNKYTKGSVRITIATSNGKLAFRACVSAASMELLNDGSDPDPFTLTLEGPDGLEMDVWDEDGFSKTDDTSYSIGNNDLSASDWVSTPYVISVGAYSTNATERNIIGENKNTDYTVNEIASFSSYGEFSNGVKAPMVCAPGCTIVSSYHPSLIDDEKENWKPGMVWKNDPYTAMSGTSMACPHVSGIIALWKQAKPTLTFDDVKKAIANSCITDSYTQKNPLLWGYGKIDAQKGLNYILNSTGIEEVRSQKTDARKAVIYDLQGRQVANPTYGLYIVNGKKVVIK